MRYAKIIFQASESADPLKDKGSISKLSQETGIHGLIAKFDTKEVYEIYFVKFRLLYVSAEVF